MRSGQMWNDDYLLGETPNDEDTDGEAAFLAGALSLKPGTRVLDVACGAGRHASRLADLGCPTVGVDTSDFLLDAASRSRTAGGPMYISADMRRLPFKDCFDVALCLFASFGLCSESGNLRALASIANAVTHDGLVLIESWNPLVAAGLDGQRNWWRVGDRLYLATAEYDAVASVAHDHREVIDLEARTERRWTRSTRFYAPSELTVMSLAVGLRPKAWYGDFDGSPYTTASPRLIALFEKARP